MCSSFQELREKEEEREWRLFTAKQRCVCVGEGCFSILDGARSIARGNHQMENLSLLDHYK